MAHPSLVRSPRRRRWFMGLCLAAATVSVYSQTFDSPFHFDDKNRIEDNPAIRHLWPISFVIAESSRPIGTYTFAVNYALNGLNVWGYHAVNLTIHIAAGLLLFGIVGRTL